MVLEDRALNETIFPQYGENNGLFSVEYTPDWEIGFFQMVSSKTVFFWLIIWYVFVKGIIRGNHLKIPFSLTWAICLSLVKLPLK